MFGFRTEFDYVECSSCGCLQIVEVPANLSKYYPPNYYAFEANELGKPNPLSKRLKRKRGTYVFGRENSLIDRFAGRLLVNVFGVPHELNLLKRLDVRLDQAVLDIGSGAGHHLIRMRDAGFSNLTGCDPYIKDDIHHPGGVVIWKRTLNEINDAYDLIMLHHSFEHMPHQSQVLKDIHRLLNSNGYVLLRIPVASSYAWRVYGEDWVQLDAPRHLFLHTEESLSILARQAGFEITSVVYDSTGFQFWGSEQYKRDIPLRHERSYAENPHSSLFTKGELRTFNTKAQHLNEERDGDQACFYLRKATFD